MNELHDWKIAHEKMARVWPELADMHMAHMEETEKYLGVKPDVDYASYIAMEQAGMFRMFVARRLPDLQVVGNLGFYIDTDHHSQQLQAWEDVFFVSEEYRRTGIGGRLLTFAESHLKGTGVGYVKMSSKHFVNGPDLTKFLTGLNYAPVALLFGKKL
jgi:GNAT superfamily N-acetyltransferase